MARSAESSACGRGNAVGLTSILDRRQFVLFHAIALTNCVACCIGIITADQ